jgi:hypothetical protein
VHDVGGRGQLQTAGTGVACADQLGTYTKKAIMIGDENAVARMVEMQSHTGGDQAKLEGRHHVPMSLRPRRQAPPGWIEVSGIACY